MTFHGFTLNIYAAFVGMVRGRALMGLVLSVCDIDR